jgi:hypothetical protein
VVRATSKKVGRGPCPECGTEVTFRESAGGFLTHKCDVCDSSGFADKGGRAWKKRMGAMKVEQEETPPATEITPPINPTTKPANKGGFSLSDL